MIRGKYTYGNPEILWAESGHQFITGKFCSIGANLKVFLGGNHRTDWVTTYPFGHIYKDVFKTFNGNGHPSSKGSVVIGNDVWIGNNVTIMSGVHIGDGVVVANNSHVVKDAPPYTLVGGNPAKTIKHRFTDDQIQELLEIQWWNWPDNKIERFTPLLCNENIDEFIHKAKSEQ